MELTGKRILLGVTGSIAAYKAAYLLRLMVKEGADVQVLMTPMARHFVGEVTFSALSGKPVLSDFFVTDGGEWNSHVDQGVRADLMIVAPVTATTLSKMASGNADNLLVATYLSARCPVLLAPAMDMDMVFSDASTGETLFRARILASLTADESIPWGTGFREAKLIGQLSFATWYSVRALISVVRYGKIDPDVTWKKLRALREGADIAASRL